MNKHKISIVFKKDWLEIRRNWQVLLPIIVVPLMFSVLLPTIIVLIPNLSPMQPTSLQGFEALIASLPANIQDKIAGMTPQQVLIYIMTLYFFAPLFLIIPLMASSVISSDSFAGEKERKTIEALLATPISDSELFTGKVLVSFVPAMIVTVASFAIYSTAVDITTLSLFNGTLLLPNADWLIIILGLAPTLALTSIGLTVIISAKVKGFREAQQISVVLLIPVLALVFAQASGAVLFGPIIVTLLIGIFALLNLLVFYTGVKVFKREEILSKPA
jgi:ABC-type Na+ efflux pump permease subunit